MRRILEKLREASQFLQSSIVSPFKMHIFAMNKIQASTKITNQASTKITNQVTQSVQSPPDTIDPTHETKFISRLIWIVKEKNNKIKRWYKYSNTIVLSAVSPWARSMLVACCCLFWSIFSFRSILKRMKYVYSKAAQRLWWHYCCCYCYSRSSSDTSKRKDKKIALNK